MPGGPKGAVIRGIVVAGTNSGCGKTTVSLGLMASFIKRGIRVAPFKVGPDFIDPGYHCLITGKKGRNLDGWMLSKEYNLSTYIRNTAENDIAVVEGVMGLFDGYDGKTESGSTAQMAKWIGAPVVLVVNARSMARSAAAVVQGFENFDSDIRFSGVVFNHVGSESHLRILKDAMSGHATMPFLGGIPRNPVVEIPERHLGLVTSDEFRIEDKTVNVLANLIEDHIDVDAILRTAGVLDVSIERSLKTHEARVRVGIARDSAFCFYYSENLELLTENGAELVYFSPISDRRLPENLDGMYLGGGYPELFAENLSRNSEMLGQIRHASNLGMPILGECGGFMYLCDELVDREGTAWRMSGCLKMKARMLNHLKALGYREVTFTDDTIIGKTNQTVRGHEFHYSEISSNSEKVENVFLVTAIDGRKTELQGFQKNRTLGSYFHLHFGSRPEAAGCFISECLQYQKEKPAA
ncbi:MAG: cobyrinate a,c-diamide synthase [Desulfobacterales bacterium]